MLNAQLIHEWMSVLIKIWLSSSLVLIHRLDSSKNVLSLGNILVEKQNNKKMLSLKKNPTTE